MPNIFQNFQDIKNPWLGKFADSWTRTTTHSYHRKKRSSLRPANKYHCGLHYVFSSNDRESYLKNGVINSHTVIHLFDNATHDVVPSKDILLVVKSLHVINPILKNLYIRSDNARCFNSCSSVIEITGIKSYLSRDLILQILKVENGSMTAEESSSSLKSTVAMYVNKDNGVRTAFGFPAAIKKGNSVNTSIW